jgi:predicted DCC family thiol-disulfide oxidoreductase YuxK
MLPEMEIQNADAAAGESEPRVENIRQGSEQPIVFFDGVCALCNHAVQTLLKIDRRHRLKFAPLQGETAIVELPEADRRELKTLVIRDHRGVARYSTAVVRILWQIGGIWSFFGTCLWLIPSPIRNWGYRFVSARRYKWFGKYESCRLPKPGERERFLP